MSKSSSHKNILVVDDVDSIRGYLCTSLKQEGYSVHEAKNGNEALQYLSEHPIDLLITDINMPLMSGVELVSAIRNCGDYDRILIVVISSKPNDKLIVQQLKINAWLVKPFNPSRINSTVRKLLM